MDPCYSDHCSRDRWISQYGAFLCFTYCLITGVFDSLIRSLEHLGVNSALFFRRKQGINSRNVPKLVHNKTGAISTTQIAHASRHRSARQNPLAQRSPIMKNVNIETGRRRAVVSIVAAMLSSSTTADQEDHFMVPIRPSLSSVHAHSATKAP